MSYIRESSVEGYLLRQVKKVGGRAPKWVSPGNDGVPDRIVIFPGNWIVFVETKSRGKGLRTTQKIQHRTLIDLGCFVTVIDTKEKVNALIRWFYEVRG